MPIRNSPKLTDLESLEGARLTVDRALTNIYQDSDDPVRTLVLCELRDKATEYYRSLVDLHNTTAALQYKKGNIEHLVTQIVAYCDHLNISLDKVL